MSGGNTDDTMKMVVIALTVFALLVFSVIINEKVNKLSLNVDELNEKLSAKQDMKQPIIITRTVPEQTNTFDYQEAITERVESEKRVTQIINDYMNKTTPAVILSIKEPNTYEIKNENITGFATEVNGFQKTDKKSRTTQTIPNKDGSKTRRGRI